VQAEDDLRGKVDIRLAPDDLSPEELEQCVADFVARDSPGPGDLAADPFFALWEGFEAERLITQTAT